MKECKCGHDIKRVYLGKELGSRYCHHKYLPSGYSVRRPCWEKKCDCTTPSPKSKMKKESE